MFGKMKGERLEIKNDSAFSLKHLYTQGVHDSVADIQAIASSDKKTAWIMVWNYYDDDLPSAPSPVTIQLNNIPANYIRIKEYMIDEEHSNSYTRWKKMGAPQNVSKEQMDILEKAGKLQQVGEEKKKIQKGIYKKTILLRRQAVSLLELSWN